MKFTSLFICLFLLISVAFSQRQPDYVDSSFSRKGELQRVYIEYFDSVNYTYEYGNGQVIFFRVDSDLVNYTYEYKNGKPVSYEATYFQVTKSVSRKGYTKTVKEGNLNLFREFYFNGNLKKEYYEKTHFGFLIASSKIDTINTWYDDGTLESQQIYSDDNSYYTAYTQSGKLKLHWEIINDVHSVKQYNSNGELLDNGDFNNRGTGYLNHYSDDGILNAKCYYRNGKLISRKCKVIYYTSL